MLLTACDKIVSRWEWRKRVGRRVLSVLVLVGVGPTYSRDWHHKSIQRQDRDVYPVPVWGKYSLQPPSDVWKSRWSHRGRYTSFSLKNSLGDGKLWSPEFISQLTTSFITAQRENTKSSKERKVYKGGHMLDKKMRQLSQETQDQLKKIHREAEVKAI